MQQDRVVEPCKATGTEKGYVPGVNINANGDTQFVVQGFLHLILQENIQEPAA
jgi:hypothetical protein